jgi:hypothetical protein
MTLVRAYPRAFRFAERSAVAHEAEPADATAERDPGTRVS